MRAPFSGLIGMSQLLLSDIEDPNYIFDKDMLKKMITGIYTSAQGAYNFADNLLRWANLEDGHKTIEITTFRLRELIEPVFEI